MDSEQPPSHNAEQIRRRKDHVQQSGMMLTRIGRMRILRPNIQCGGDCNHVMFTTARKASRSRGLI